MFRQDVIPVKGKHDTLCYLKVFDTLSCDSGNVVKTKFLSRYGILLANLKAVVVLKLTTGFANKKCNCETKFGYQWASSAAGIIDAALYYVITNSNNN